MQARAALLPYIYTATRQAFDTGMSLLRPMYYYFPTEPMAYAGDQTGNFSQYFFGEDMFVAPVVSPANQTNNMAQQNIWVPPGNAPCCTLLFDIVLVVYTG